jgi:hypothetical protein
MEVQSHAQEENQSRVNHRQWQIEIAHEWRERHHLPRLSDNEAITRHWGIEAEPLPRRRMNTSEHVQRLLKVWDTWKHK